MARFSRHVIGALTVCLVQVLVGAESLPSVQAMPCPRAASQLTSIWNVWESESAWRALSTTPYLFSETLPFTCDERRLFVPDISGEITVLDLDGVVPIASIQTQAMPDDQYVVIDTFTVSYLDRNCAAVLLDWEMGAIWHEAYSDDPIASIDFSPARRQVIISHGSGVIQFMNPKSFECGFVDLDTHIAWARVLPDSDDVLATDWRGNLYLISGMKLAATCAPGDALREAGYPVFLALSSYFLDAAAHTDTVSLLPAYDGRMYLLMHEGSTIALRELGLFSAHPVASGKFLYYMDRAKGLVRVDPGGDCTEVPSGSVLVGFAGDGEGGVFIIEDDRVKHCGIDGNSVLLARSKCPAKPVGKIVYVNGWLIMTALDKVCYGFKCEK